MEPTVLFNEEQKFKNLLVKEHFEGYMWTATKENQPQVTNIEWLIMIMIQNIAE
jgi:hypothetical protein